MQISKLIKELQSHDIDTLVECTSNSDELNILLETAPGQEEIMLASEQSMTVGDVLRIISDKVTDKSGTVKLFSHNAKGHGKSADVLKLVSVNAERLFPMADFDHSTAHADATPAQVIGNAPVSIDLQPSTKFIVVKDRYGKDLIINVEHIISVIYVDEGVSEIKLDNGETRPSRTPISKIYELIS